jgi:hypothetical protein
MKAKPKIVPITAVKFRSELAALRECFAEGELSAKQYNAKYEELLIRLRKS